LEPNPPVNPHSSLRARSGWAGKLLLSVGLLWLALHKVPVASLRTALGQADPFWCILSLLVSLAGLMVFEPLRLAAGGRLLRETQPRATLWLALFAESRAFLYLLPSGMGQEGYLWWKLRKYGWDHGSCGFLVVIVRVTGLALWMLVMARALATPAFRDACRSVLIGPLSAPTAWGAAGAALLVLSLGLPPLLVRLEKLRRYRLAPAPWTAFLAATAASMFFSALAFQLAARAFHLPFALDQASGCLTLLFIGMVLPISLAGLGLQETILLMLGHGLGLPVGPVLGLSCLLHAQRLIPAVAGMGVLLVQRKRPSD